MSTCPRVSRLSEANDSQGQSRPASGQETSLVDRGSERKGLGPDKVSHGGSNAICLSPGLLLHSSPWSPLLCSRHRFLPVPGSTTHWKPLCDREGQRIPAKPQLEAAFVLIIVLHGGETAGRRSIIYLYPKHRYFCYIPEKEKLGLHILLLTASESNRPKGWTKREPFPVDKKKVLSFYLWRCLLFPDFC